MNLSTEYLGLRLASPIIVGASPFGDDVQTAQLLQDMGAGALVMRSLFEEQIYLDALEAVARAKPGLPPPEKAISFFPPLSHYQLAPGQYLKQIGQLKRSLGIPVIASLNGCRPGGWIHYGRRFQEAGADAIELNLYQLAADPAVSSADVEEEMLETVRLLRASVTIPVAVKLSPFFTALGNFSRKLELAGANGLILFNRLLQADLNHEEQQEELRLELSKSSELPLRLRWLALLSPELGCSLAVTGGIHSSEDMGKAIAAGADAVQVVSVLLKNGPRILATILDAFSKWMHNRGYQSVDQLRDTMNLQSCLDRSSHERADYQHILQLWRI